MEFSTKYNIVLSQSQEFRGLSEFWGYLGVVLRFLVFKLSKLRVLAIENGQDVKFVKLPVRGTKDYFEFYTAKRFKQIKRGLSELIKVEGNKTNAIFLTLTFDFEVENFKSLDYLWANANKKASEFIDKFRKKIKRAGGGFEYVKVIEAQRCLDYGCKLNGKPHFHFIIIFPNQFFRFHRKEGKFWFSSKKQYQKLLEMAQETWGLGFVSISPVHSSGGAVSYVSKYISKSGGYVQDILEKAKIENLNSLSETEIKKLILFYYLLLFRLRFFSVSRGLTKLDKQQKNNSDALSEKKWRLYRGDIPVWVFREFKRGKKIVILSGFLNSG